MSRETVLAYLWPESDEERARTSLKQLVRSLRQQAGEPALLLSTPTLRLNPDVITSDVAEFRDAVRRRDYEAAVGLYAGPFLDGFYLRGADDVDQWAATALRWRRLAHAEPLSARGATGFMLALDAVGERAAALQHARAFQQLVHEEVGGAPDPSVAALVTRLQSFEAVPLTVSAPRLSVAVLPFANTSGDPADEPLSDGLTDELIGALGKVVGLKVAGRTSAFALRGRGMGVRAVADTAVSSVVRPRVSRRTNCI